MFTGLVEHIGTVSAITPLDTTASGGSGFSLTIAESAPILGDCHVGDSICVNGVCLTVTEFEPEKKGGWFKVGLAPETLSRTDLGELQVGGQVNLERAMAPTGRYGGHVVQGHVDTTAVVKAVTPDGNSLRLDFILEKPSAYLVPKGYVTLDGTSLTLTHVSPRGHEFGIMLIAHTQEKVILPKKKPGDKVNVEFDVVAKGVERIVCNILGMSVSGNEGGAEGGSLSALEEMVERAVERALAKRGVGA